MATERKFNKGDIVKLDQNIKPTRPWAANQSALARVSGYDDAGKVSVIWQDNNTSHGQSDGGYSEHHFVLVQANNVQPTDVVKTAPGVYLALDGKKYSARCKAQAASQAYRTVHRLDEDKPVAPRQIKVGDTVRFKLTYGNDSYSRLLGKTAKVEGRRTVNSGKVFLEVRWLDVESNLCSWYEERFELVGPDNNVTKPLAKRINGAGEIGKLNAELVELRKMCALATREKESAIQNLAQARGQLKQSGEHNTKLVNEVREAKTTIKELKTEIKLLQAKVGLNDIIIVNRRSIAL